MKKICFAAVLLMACLMPTFAFASGHMGGISGEGAAIIIGLFLIILITTFFLNVYSFNIAFLSRRKQEPVVPFIAGCVNSLWLYCIASGRDRFPVGYSILFVRLIAMNVVAFMRTIV